MTGEAQRILRVLLDLVVLSILLWLSLPARPPVQPYLWRAVARACETVSDRTAHLSLIARTRYWRSVQP